MKRSTWICFTLRIAAVLALAPLGLTYADEPTPWVFELKGGLFEPDLPLYKEFYGDDGNGYVAVAFSHQFRRWLEMGGEIGYSRDSGVGAQPANSQLAGSVRYTLVPVHLYVNLLGKKDYKQLFVPYAGLGLTTAYYRQEIESQSNRDGGTDLGYNARVGVQLLLDRLDPGLARSLSANGPVQTYLTLEAQWFTTEVDNTDLGGVTYLLGLRFEWGKGK